MSKNGFDFNINGVGDNFSADRRSRFTNQSAKTATDEVSSRIRITDVPLEKITPRPINNYSQNRIDRLAKSIRNTDNRLIHPIILVKPSDLPKTSPVLAKFEEKGIDVSNIEYVIVAGERRFTAWTKLREEEQIEVEKRRENGDLFATNCFDKIPANILTRVEAQHEEAYYEDSNVEARSLSGVEALRHVKTALAEAVTTEQKRSLLLEMNRSSENPVPETQIPSEDKSVNRAFSQVRFIKWYLEGELGISGWTDSKVKDYQSVVNNCSENVQEAVLKNQIPFIIARRITDIPMEEQDRYLPDLIKGGQTALKTILEERKSIPAKSTYIDHTDAKKKVVSLAKGMEKDISDFKKINEKLGADYKKCGDQLLKKMVALQKEYVNAAEHFTRKR